MVMVPVRYEPAFALTLNVIGLGPLLAAPLVTVMNGLLLTAVQAQIAGAVTLSTALVTPLVFFSLLLLVVWCVSVGVRGVTGARPTTREGQPVPNEPGPSSTAASGRTA